MAKATRCSVNDWPDGKNATRRCRCIGDWSVTCRPAGSSTNPIMPNWWCWEAVVGVDTLACVWAQSVPRSCSPCEFPVIVTRRPESVINVKDQIRYASAWLDEKLTKLEGAEYFTVLLGGGR